jgi:hypothetical protein
MTFCVVGQPLTALLYTHDYYQTVLMARRNAGS